MADRVQVRELGDDEGQRLLRILRRVHRVARLAKAVSAQSRTGRGHE